MGKYMRKCRGAAGKAAAMEVTQVVGVRTRSRAAATAAAVAEVAAKRRRASPPVVEAPRLEAAAAGVGCDGDGCYLHLRSRRLFMAAVAAPRAPRSAEGKNSAVGAVAAGGISRCSSTASSVDVEGYERRRDAAEECEDRDLESSVSNSECGRERRETTPSSRLSGELSDLESDQAEVTRRRRLPETTAAAATVPAAVRARMPAAAEIEAFFAAAEKAEADRFAAKYNFDVVRGVPLAAGRFEWAPVVSG